MFFKKQKKCGNRMDFGKKAVDFCLFCRYNIG